MTKSELSEEIQLAVTRLLKRQHRLRLRAFRARVDSNERRKCLRQADYLHACAVELATDKRTQKDLEGSMGVGWRGLAASVSEAISKRLRKQGAS